MVEYVVAIDVTRVRFPADAFLVAAPLSGIAMFVAYLVARHWQWSVDTLAEWLRRRPAKPVGSARVGSNPTGVGFRLSHATGQKLCLSRDLKFGLYKQAVCPSG